MKDYKEIIVEDEVQQTEKKTVGEVVSKILAAVCIIVSAKTQFLNYLKSFSSFIEK